MAWCLAKHKDNFTFTFGAFLLNTGFLRHVQKELITVLKIASMGMWGQDYSDSIYD
jgi:hypothetical protein